MIKDCLCLGVVGNVANHLKQANEAKDFTILNTSDYAPKGVFPFYSKHSDKEFLKRFCISENELILDGDFVQIEPELCVIFKANYKNDELIDKIENIETKFDVECDDNSEVEELSSKVEFLSNSDFDISKTMESEAIPYNHNAELENSQLQTMIYHQTQELKTDFIHQKKEIDEVNNKIDRVNLILNITLGVLVFAIIVILVFFVYQLLKINGVF